MSECMRRPNFRIGQTFMALSSLVVDLSKLICVNDYHVSRGHFAECECECPYKLLNNHIDVVIFCRLKF